MEVGRICEEFENGKHVQTISHGKFSIKDQEYIFRIKFVHFQGKKDEKCSYPWKAISEFKIKTFSIMWRTVLPG